MQNAMEKLLKDSYICLFYAISGLVHVRLTKDKQIQHVGLLGFPLHIPQSTADD